MALPVLANKMEVEKQPWRKNLRDLKYISHHFHMTTMRKMLAEDKKKKKKRVGVRDKRDR